MAWTRAAIGKKLYNSAWVVGGGLGAWTLGGALGDAVFGDEGQKNMFLQDRQDRYEKEHPIYRFTYDKPKHEVQLSPDEWRYFPVEDTKGHAKTGKVLRLQLPSLHGRTGGEVAYFVLVRYRGEDGKWVVRPYTPISMDWEFGHVDLLVKKYPDGKMGHHLHGLKKGDRVQVKGPFQKLEIKPNQFAQVGCIAGGSGITPMFQVAMYLMKTPEDKTNVSLLYANVHHDDILMKKSLDMLSTVHNRCCVFHTVENAPLGWRGAIGRVNKEMIKSKMPPPGQGKVLVCGPPAMVAAVAGPKVKFEQGPLGGMLKELGYTEEDVYKF
eukprot:TRINITY_DN22403_c0_g1_i1.p1 TRINITY_DN22403_c0_g1~~TRINITY_DN22403_c0_g1_i1.p1  ORF type:complete len:324 (+),score=113.21 TRINITY_DN22403_c0_g1_i1:67-1038(+)